MQNYPPGIAASYEGVEDEALFPSRTALDEYRSLLKDRSREQVDFIASRLPAKSDVLEVGCGNGRLLIELAHRGAMQGGLGLDLARSRIEFARQWAADELLTNLKFEPADALGYPLPAARFEAAMGIGCVLAYFGVSRGSDAQLLKHLQTALVPGGVLLLELFPHHGIRQLIETNGGEVRVWRELPPEDQWRFYLSTLSMQGDVLTTEKTFIHRTNGEIDEGRVDRIRLYTAGEIQGFLAETGFEDVRLHGGWTDLPYADHEVMVVTARKQAG